MDLEVVRGRLVGDSQHFVAEMSRGARALGMVTTASGPTTRAMNILRGGMTSLAVQATGTAGPVGKLAQGLLMLGGGGGLVLGVAAGIGAITLAYKVLTRDTREAEQAQQDLIKALQGVGVHAQLTAARIKLAGLQAKQAQGQSVGEVFSQFLSDMSGGLLGTSREEQKERVARDIASTQTAIGTLTQDVAKWQGEVADQTARAADEAQRLKLEAIEFLQVTLQLEKGGVFQALRPGFQAPTFGAGGLAPGPSDATFENIRKNVPRFVPDPFPPKVRDKFMEASRELGISLGRQLALGLIDGFDDMQDLMKSIFMAVLDFALGAILNSILPGAGIGVAAAAGAANVPGQMSVVGPASMSINMSGVQPLTAYAVSRDPAFQALLREGILVANAAGFKG